MNEFLCNDPRIKYIGRWDKRNNDVYAGYWGGTYFKVKFHGTAVSIALQELSDISVSIDGDDEVFFDNVSGIVDLAADRLNEGIHTVRVTTQFITRPLYFQKVILNSTGTLLEADVLPKLIEFVGDSITNACWVSPRNTQLSYAWLTGEKLQTEHTQIANAGISLVKGYGYLPDNPGMSNQYFTLKQAGQSENIDWGFSVYTSDLIVINLGTNDSASGTPSDEFQKTYIDFIRNIRGKFDMAQIFVMQPVGGYMAEQSRDIVDKINQDGDKKVTYIDTAGWINGTGQSTGTPIGDTSDGVHPTQAGHIKIADKLSKILGEYLERD
ncbi:MAG: SGNH/GDSL hydrolase family protein [Saccharofermentanales bacterium]